MRIKHWILSHSSKKPLLHCVSNVSNLCLGLACEQRPRFYGTFLLDSLVTQVSEVHQKTEAGIVTSAFKSTIVLFVLFFCSLHFLMSWSAFCAFFYRVSAFFLHRLQ